MEAGHGYVDVSGMVQLRSSCIQGVQYNKGNGSAFIRFVNGGLYLVKKVKKITITRMISSYSPGAYYHRNIRDKYSITKI
jgi:hypothetical protein